MLRITVNKEGSGTRFIVEGKLVEPRVGELRRCWETAARLGEGHAIVDLAGVTLIDSHGRALLAQMQRQGTQLLARRLMTQAILEDIQQSKQ